MLPPTTKIRVTAVDNELILIASQKYLSSVLLHLKSGFDDQVEYSIDPGDLLPSGEYDLTMIGINWNNDPTQFKVTLTTGGNDQVYEHPRQENVPPGVTWKELVHIIVKNRDQ